MSNFAQIFTKRMKKVKILATIVVLLCKLPLWSQDTVVVSNTDTTLLEIQPKKKNLIQKIVAYLADKEGNTLEDKDVSFSFIGGPYYGSDIKLALAITGTVNYRTQRCPKTMEPSYASIVSSVSTAGFWRVGADGTTFFNADKSRLNYKIEFGYSPRNFWGIGYDNAIIEDRVVNLKQRQSTVHVEYIYSLFPRFFVGPAVEWNYNKAGKNVSSEVLEGQDHMLRNYGAGLVLQYDSRDLITNASKGFYAHLNAMINPKFMGNKYAYTMLDFTSSYYHTAWRGAIVAAQLNAKFNMGNPSWAMMSMLGGNAIMRGYYEGRFRDKHSTSLQLELRQHVWKRHGIVVWGGVGNVFHDKATFKNILPNYGIGYRFEFRNKMNIRLDYGIGTHKQSAVIFSMNEAF